MTPKKTPKQRLTELEKTTPEEPILIAVDWGQDKFEANIDGKKITLTREEFENWPGTRIVINWDDAADSRNPQDEPSTDDPGDK